MELAFRCLLFLEGIGSVHQQADMRKVVHRAKEEEQHAGGAPAKTNKVYDLPILFRDCCWQQQLAERNQTPQ
jgi:hypothetical protein